MTEGEQLLAGGNASGAVVRVGSTVRKPWTAAAGGVTEFMLALRRAGVDVPEPRGRDERGRFTVEHVPGRLALDGPPLGLHDLHRVGAMVRKIHDASEGFVPQGAVPWATAVPAPGADLICHNDLAPWNLVLGDRWIFIDWDAAGPSTRLWDLAYAAQAFTLQDPHQDPAVAGSRLAAFVDGYGADESLRAALPETMVQRAAAMLELLDSSHRAQREPWGSMYVAGHGEHWRSVLRYTETYLQRWQISLSQAGG